MRNSRPRDDLRFSSRKISAAGVFSVLLSLGCILLFPAAVYVSYRADGQAGSQVGAMGMLALIIGLIGLSLAAAERRNDDVSQKLPKAGLRLGAAGVLLWIIILIIGLGT